MVSSSNRLAVAIALAASLVQTAFPVAATQAATHVAEAITQPSFDCTRARSKVEKSICADPQLAASDQRVADLFALALAQALDAGDLKKSQRRWLDDRDDCKDPKCISDAYAQRSGELSTITGRFSQGEAGAMCAKLGDPETRAAVLERKAGADDINNDGSADKVSQCFGGTANVPCVEYKDAKDKPIVVQPQGFEWMTYSAFGRAPFRHEARTFVFYANDDGLGEPAYVSYITPTNREVRICDFDTKIGSAVVEGGAEVCAAVEADDAAIEAIVLPKVTDEKAFATARPQTYPKSVGKADIDNDGLEEDLVEYEFASGAARGCDINYYELLAEDGRTLLLNSNATPVQELQGLSGDGANGRNCGRLESRLFRFGSKVYYERNITNSAGTPHEVRLLEGTAVSTVCTFERQVTTKVKTVF